MTKEYVVQVDDNFHYMDENERYEAARFESLEEAVRYCQDDVRRQLEHYASRTSSPADLVDHYKDFGEDPWIAGPPGTPSVPFSAWTYAEEIAAEVFAATHPATEEDAP